MLHTYKKIFILKLNIMVQEMFSWYVLYCIYCKVEKYVKLPMPYWWFRIKNIVRHGIHRYDFWRLFLLSRHDALCQIFFNIRNIIKGTEIVGLLRSCKPRFFFLGPPPRKKLDLYHKPEKTHVFRTWKGLKQTLIFRNKGAD